MASIATILLVYSFTGEVKIAVTIGLLEVVVKLLLFYAHERAWNKISFGRVSDEKVAADESATVVPAAVPPTTEKTSPPPSLAPQSAHSKA